LGYRNWTLIVGCSAFIVVGLIAVVAGATVTTAAFRAVVSSFIGGLFGFAMDYFAAQAPQGPGGRTAAPSRQAGED
jgi:membrane protein YqaA with SNARE-associated domain